MTATYRGETFRPAQEWYRGDPNQRASFALERLGDVSGLLVRLAREEEQRAYTRGWRRLFRRRGSVQRVYDLEDASRTVNDARYAIRTALDA